MFTLQEASQKAATNSGTRHRSSRQLAATTAHHRSSSRGSRPPRGGVSIKLLLQVASYLNQIYKKRIMSLSSLPWMAAGPPP